MKTFTKGIRTAAFGLAGILAATLAGTAIDRAAAAEVNWKVVTNIRDSKQTTDKWAWFASEVEKRSEGRMAIEVSTFAELGLKGGEFIRLLNTGLMDAGELVTGYVSGEVPLVEGVQMMGVYDDLEQAEKAYAAWTEEVVQPNARRLGGKPVASFAFSTMMLWSKFPVESLDDLKGKKIRIFSTAQADYLKELGAEPVTIPLSEVYPSLERGVVDAVITGPDVANRTKLYEVVDHVTDLKFGPGAGWVVISERAWKRLPADLQQIVEDLIPELQKRGWQLAFEENDVNLKATIDKGIKATVPAKAEWTEELHRIAHDVVIPSWTKRAGNGSAEAFNAAIAPIVGVKAE